VQLKHKGTEFQIKARCTCNQSSFLGFFLRLIWPLLWLLRLVASKQFGTGSLTVTVTNDSGDSGTLQIANINYQ
jgi:hypothetical protein